MARSLALLTLPLAIVLLCGPAIADENPCQPSDGLSTCIASDNLWPYGGGGRWLSQAPTSTVPGGAAFGFVNSYLHRPIGLVVASPDPAGTRVFAVEHALSATLLTAVGVNRWLHLDLAMPMMLFQEGASKADVVGSDQALPRSAVGDLRFGSHVVLLPNRPAGVGLAVRFQMTAPTGQRDAFVSSPSASFAPGVSADCTLGALSLGVDVGQYTPGSKWFNISPGTHSFGYNMEVSFGSGDPNKNNAGRIPAPDTIILMDYTHDAILGSDALSLIAARHGGKANVLFADGHVRAMTVDELLDPDDETRLDPRMLSVRPGAEPLPDRSPETIEPDP